MKHHVINRPPYFRQVVSAAVGGGLPVFQGQTPPAIEWIDGVFTTANQEEIDFLRARGDGVRYGIGVDYWEVPYEERQAQIEAAKSKRPVTHEELMNRVEELESRLGGDGEDVPEPSLSATGEEAAAPKRKTRGRPKKLADTIEG